jgi:GNAT superfamily N-acetyltransferase
MSGWRKGTSAKRQQATGSGRHDFDGERRHRPDQAGACRGAPSRDRQRRPRTQIPSDIRGVPARANARLCVEPHRERRSDVRRSLRRRGRGMVRHPSASALPCLLPSRSPPDRDRFWSSRAWNWTATPRRSAELAFDRGFARVELDVRSDNGRAIALYEKLGFVREGIVRDTMLVDGQYYDAVAMAVIRRSS